MNKGVIFLPSLHNFEKLNVKPRKSNNEFYDVYQCKNCGIHGKRFSLESCIVLTKDFPKEKINFCDKKDFDFVGKLIEITKINTIGSNYDYCLSGSRHMIIQAPFGQFNGDRGVFINGKYGPVKLFFDEFVFVKKRRTK